VTITEHGVAQLRYADRFVRELPGDPRDDNRTRQVLGACYSRVAPTAVPRPELLALVPEVAALIELEPQATPELVDVLAGNRVVPGMGTDIREHVEKALKLSRVQAHTLTRVVGVSRDSLTIEHEGAQTEISAAGVVWVGGVRVNPLIENLQVEKTRNGLLKVTPTLQIPGQENVFALGDGAHYEDADAPLAGTAQLAFQESVLAAQNVRALLAGEKLQTKHFEEIGEALSLGTERGAVLTGGHPRRMQMHQCQQGERFGSLAGRMFR